MSEENTTVSTDDLDDLDTTESQKDPSPKSTEPKPSPKGKKVFTRGDVKRSVGVSVHLPKLYPDYEPWNFELRLKLSKEAEERRQEYLSLSASEMTVKLRDQALDEICDLLVSAPTGFGDLQDTGQGPGHSFRSYVETSDPETKDMLLSIVEGADNLYWTSISPREFRREV